MNFKTCPKCLTSKSTNEFNKNRTARDGLQSYCRPCAYTANKPSLRRYANSPAGKASAKRLMRRYWYGIEQDQFESMLRGQGYACAICRQAFGEARKDMPQVDHQHGHCDVGQKGCAVCVRGLVHARCNKLVSWFETNGFIQSRVELEGIVREYVISHDWRIFDQTIIPVAA